MGGARKNGSRFCNAWGRFLFSAIALNFLYIWPLKFQIISYDSPRGGVSVITNKGDVTASFLVMQHALPTDSGTYSCSPSLGETVSVNVHVLRGNVTV